jgi:phosphate transport system substrate-binding protein
MSIHVLLEEETQVIRGFKLACAVVAVLMGSAAAQTTVNGAGATFPYPIYSKWFSEYHKLHSDIEINYQPIGSGGGIRQVTSGTVDFGGTDGPMSDEQLASSKVKIQHIPTVMGSVVPAYNIPGVSAELKFTPEVLAGIFLGKISSWNDNAIQSINKDVKLPNQTINVVHRSDGSGTTYVFTDYLSKVSPDWKTAVGKGTSVRWPVGIGGKGNEGVAGSIRSVDGSIGYVELIYALQNKITYGSVKNAAGEFLKANLENTSAASKGVKIPDDYRVSITNSPNKDAYPISTFTWLLIPTKSADPNKGKIIKDFLNWMIDDGEKMAPQLSYAELPDELQQRVKKTISTLQ